MNELIKKALFYIFVLALVWILSGCANTCRGFGGLVQGAGQTVAGIGQDITEAVDSQREQ